MPSLPGCKPMQAPDFWTTDGACPRLLSPLGALYAKAALHRLRAPGVHVGVPVICVGNAVLGGAGKTPVALAVAKILTHKRVFFLSRGHGGSLAGPVQVDINHHTARDVGDEPLLLARVAPTFVARDRLAGARACMHAGAEVIVMDDGLQNPSLAKTLSLLVVDAAYGFGNGRVFPAGPLREPAEHALARVDAVVRVGEGELILPPGLPVFHASLVPENRWQGQRVCAFAGIGRPQKFLDTLRGMGAEVVHFSPYPDHHVYSENQLRALTRSAGDLPLLTTEKDHVRLPPSWRERIHAVPVSLHVREKDAWAALLKGSLSA